MHGKRLCVLALKASHSFFFFFFLKGVRETLKRVGSVSRPHAAINVRSAGSEGANGRRFVGNPVPQAVECLSVTEEELVWLSSVLD